MIWILAVIVVGLIAVLAEMVLVYQRRAYDLHIKQEPLRRRVRRHRKEMVEAVERIRTAAQQGFRAFEEELADRKLQLESRKQLLVELEHEVLVEYQEAQQEETAPEEAAAVIPAVIDRGQELRSLVSTVQNKRDELENSLSSLQRDLDIAQRLLDRLENTVHRKLGGDDQKNGAP